MYHAPAPVPAATTTTNRSVEPLPSSLPPPPPLHELQDFLGEARAVLDELQVENTCALLKKAEFKAAIIPFLRSAAGLSSGALDAVAFQLVQFSQTMALPRPLVESALPHMAVISGRTKGGSGSANAATSLRGRACTLLHLLSLNLRALEDTRALSKAAAACGIPKVLIGAMDRWDVLPATPPSRMLMARC